MDVNRHVKVQASLQGIRLLYAVLVILLSIVVPAPAASAMAPLGMYRAVQMAHVLNTVDAGLEPVLINGRLFRLERAVMAVQWEQGLMDRTHIDVDGGMLFAYPFPQHQSFWMANCLIDMDILFLDARGRIVAMHEMKAQPLRGLNETEVAYHARLPRYTSGKVAQYALEIQSGMAGKIDVELGDQVLFDRARIAQLTR